MPKSGILVTKVCFLSLAASLTHAALAQDFQGTWQGSIPVKFETLNRPYVFRIAKVAPNHWAAGVIIDQDWGVVWRADSVFTDGRRIKFTVQAFGSTYDGSLSEDGGSMRGTWSLGTQLVPMRMVRATATTLWRETPHKTRFVTVEKNVKLEVLDWGGKGRPIVMLAGAGLTAHLFSQFAAKLTPHYHVYGITRRGEGASSAPAAPEPVFTVAAPNTYELRPPHNNPYNVERLGDDVIAVLDTLHIERPVFVGHSIAGEELTSVASRYPNRVAGLIYLDAFAEFAFSDGRRYDALFTDEHPMRGRSRPAKLPIWVLMMRSCLECTNIAASRMFRGWRSSPYHTI